MPTSNSMPCFTIFLLVYVILVFLQRINTTAINISGALSLYLFYLSGTLPIPNWASSAAPMHISNFSVQGGHQNVLGLYSPALWSRVSIQGEILGSHEDQPFLRNHSPPLPIVKCLKLKCLTVCSVLYSCLHQED